MGKSGNLWNTLGGGGRFSFPRYLQGLKGILNYLMCLGVEAPIAFDEGGVKEIKLGEGDGENTRIYNKLRSRNRTPSTRFHNTIVSRSL